MSGFSKLSLLVGTAAIALSIAASAPVQAAAMTPVERLYADLNKLPEAERLKRLEAGAKKEGKLNLVPPFRGKLMRGHTKLFRKNYGFLKITEGDMSSSEAPTRVLAEEKVGRHLTDAIAVAVPDMARLFAANLSARYPTPAAKRVLTKYRAFMSKDNLWLPSTWSEHGISYNSKILKESDAPKTWQNLCDPKYKGNVSYEPPHSTFIIGLFNMVGRDYGKYENLASCINKNEPIIQKGHTTRLQLMLAGDHPIMGDNFLYKGTQAAKKNPKKAPFKAVYTAEVFGWPVAITINTNTPNPYATALWADWNLSDQSQKYWAKNYRGTLTLPHPFMPKDAKLITYVAEKHALVTKLHALWTKHAKKGH